MDCNKLFKSAHCPDLVRAIPLHCVSWVFHPIFGWIQFILNL